MDDERFAAEQEHADRQWLMFIRTRAMNARLGPWQRSNGEGGARLSVRVHGPDTVTAVQDFALWDNLLSPAGAFHRPALDYTVPGRTACVWRSNGVWVEFWHPDPIAAPTPHALGAAPKPSAGPASRGSARQLLISRASGRLPFTRRKKEKTT